MKAYGRYSVQKIDGGYGVFETIRGYADGLLFKFTNKGSDFKNEAWAESKAEKLMLTDLGQYDHLDLI